MMYKQAATEKCPPPNGRQEMTRTSLWKTNWLPKDFGLDLKTENLRKKSSQKTSWVTNNEVTNS